MKKSEELICKIKINLRTFPLEKSGKESRGRMASFISEYNNIMNLAKRHNFRKIMIMRNSWNDGSWCIVNKVVFKPDMRYGYAYGHIHYANGNKSNGSIPCAETYAWKVIKVFNEKMEVDYMKK